MENEKLNTSKNSQSCQTAVSNSITLCAKVPPQFAKAVVDLHEQHNVKLIGISDLDEKGFRNDNWKRVVVTGLEEDLIKLNKHCEKLAYANVLLCDVWVRADMPIREYPVISSACDEIFEQASKCD